MSTESTMESLSQPQLSEDCFEEYASNYLTEESAKEFLKRISPSRDLICPITLTIFYNPVIALGDGQTYEKEAILMWLQTQRNGGSIRSPVSNAYMEGSNVMGLVANKAVADMARHFRESLGRHLCHFVEAINENSSLGDGGYRIRNVVEMGADLSVKGEGGDTALMNLVRKGQIELIQFFLTHNVSLTTVNDEGLSCIDLIQQETREGNNSPAWKNILKVAKEKANIEIEKKQELEHIRDENNAQQRERQRVLATEARNITAMNRNGTMIDGNLIQNGLGSLEDGYGYFPSLFTLQFQGSIPPPSASFAEVEGREKARLQNIIKWISGAVFIIWILG